MANNLLIFLIGFISTAFAQTQGPVGGTNLLGNNEIIYVDPFMTQKCEDKGINFEELTMEKATCIQEATTNYILSKGAITDTFEAMTVACKIRDSIDSCLETFIDGAKKCYDTEAEKKQVEKAESIVDATYDYMCEDDAQKMKDTFSNLGNMLCVMKMTDGAEKCITKMLKYVNASKLHLQNEETCRATFEITKCLIEPMKDCDSSEPYDFFAGLMDTTIQASDCRKYDIPRLSSAAGTLLYSTCIMFWLCSALLAFRF